MKRKQVMAHTSLLVLALLSAEDMYGYQMIAALSGKLDSTFAMKEGTLYPILHALENDGSVTSYEKEAAAGKPRKYYHLTMKGKLQLREEQSQWRAYQRAVDAVVSSAVLA
ncbi:MAG: PadR family transcriptional regulator [Oscillospiraceae bacterium]|nr:PadR family transcriptional regulator [Oscillospiraceae bacterium]